MMTAKSCPACGGDDQLYWPALVASFIQEYALQARVERCRLLECRTCGLRYFDLRYTEVELARLYGDYRGRRYQECRQRHERLYTAEYNAELGGDSAGRNIGIADFFRKHAGPHTSGSVVDYGGDRGQHIPVSFTGPRYVFEISGKPTVPGVASIGDLAELQKLKPYYVLLAHVLEHLPEPLETLRQIGSFIADQGKLYIEVPKERLGLTWLGRGPAYGMWLKVLARHGRIRCAVDAYMGLARRLGDFIPPFGYALLHEHINFFHEPSLRAVLARAGFRTLVVEADSGVFRALAEPMRVPAKPNPP